jgi:hypothetical protein
LCPSVEGQSRECALSAGSKTNFSSSGFARSIRLWLSALVDQTLRSSWMNLSRTGSRALDISGTLDLEAFLSSAQT